MSIFLIVFQVLYLIFFLFQVKSKLFKLILHWDACIRMDYQLESKAFWYVEEKSTIMFNCTRCDFVLGGDDDDDDDDDDADDDDADDD